MAATAAVMEIFGHEDVRRDLAAAFHRETLPGSILIHGPAGVGRQSLGRWLARLLVCQEPGPAEPCGNCTACRLALDLQHPDIHWFFPLPRPKAAASPERLADALEATRFETLAERRENSIYFPPDDELVGLYLAQVRTIRRLGSTRPAMAERQVFIIGNAELLVPQEASEEAANALLKILEEPPPATTFVLTARDPDSLLPTIRSRLLPVRLSPLRPEQIASFLQASAGVDPERARLLARLGNGSIQGALAFVSRDGEPTRADEIRATALEWIEATVQPDGEHRFGIALRQKPTGARAGFDTLLATMALWLRDLAAVAAGADDQVVGVDAMDRLRRIARRIRAARIPEAVSLVEEAREDGRINANPQLTLAWLLNRVGHVLRLESPS
jgi:DNA polymerase III subunit delta'